MPCASNAGAIPDLWTAWTQGMGGSGISWSTDAAVTGGGAVRIVDNDGEGRGIDSSHIPVVPGAAYYVTAWHKRAPNGGTPSSDVYLQFFDAAGNRVAAFAVSNPSTDSWQFQGVGGFAPSSAVTANALVYSNRVNQGTDYVDAVTPETA